MREYKHSRLQTSKQRISGARIRPRKRINTKSAGLSGRYKRAAPETLKNTRFFPSSHLGYLAVHPAGESLLESPKNAKEYFFVKNYLDSTTVNTIEVSTDVEWSFKLYNYVIPIHPPNLELKYFRDEKAFDGREFYTSD